MNLYLDIETIPSQSPEVHARIAETIKPPANYKKADTIAAWEQHEKPAVVKETIAKTSFDGSVGHVCCIGTAVGGYDATSAIIEDVSGEAALIEQTFRALDKMFSAEPYASVTIVGHNVINFDIRFLWQRAIVLGIRMPQWFPREPKPWGNEAFDTMTAFAGSRGTIGMDRLCLALGMDGKGDMDGSMVADLWAAGEFDKIATYCRADVERTRQIHKRMQIAFGEAA
jgi:DNA polymerase elongation subunit (family B)